MTALVSEAHALGIKIIVDVAFNHTGGLLGFSGLRGKTGFPVFELVDWHRWPCPSRFRRIFNPRTTISWWGIKDMPD